MSQTRPSAILSGNRKSMQCSSGESHLAQHLMIDAKMQSTSVLEGTTPRKPLHARTVSATKPPGDKSRDDGGASQTLITWEISARRIPRGRPDHDFPTHGLDSSAERCCPRIPTGPKTAPRLILDARRSRRKARGLQRD